MPLAVALTALCNAMMPAKMTLAHEELSLAGHMNATDQSHGQNRIAMQAPETPLLRAITY